MTQSELSEKTGITESQISLYISEKRKMSYLSAVKISFVLKCHVEDLYVWEEKIGALWGIKPYSTFFFA